MNPNDLPVHRKRERERQKKRKEKKKEIKMNILNLDLGSKKRDGLRGREGELKRERVCVCVKPFISNPNLGSTKR